jgi:hypothetical protein
MKPRRLGRAIRRVAALHLEADHHLAPAALRDRLQDFQARQHLVEGDLPRVGAEKADGARHIREEQRKPPPHDHATLIGGEPGTMGTALTEADRLQ